MVTSMVVVMVLAAICHLLLALVVRTQHLSAIRFAAFLSLGSVCACICYLYAYHSGYIESCLLFVAIGAFLGSVYGHRLSQHLSKRAKAADPEPLDDEDVLRLVAVGIEKDRVHQRLIKRFAEAYWREAGKPEGRDLEFWLRAERELM